MSVVRDGPHAALLTDHVPQVCWEVVLARAPQVGAEPRVLTVLRATSSDAPLLALAAESIDPLTLSAVIGYLYAIGQASCQAMVGTQDRCQFFALGSTLT